MTHTHTHTHTHTIISSPSLSSTPGYKGEDARRVWAAIYNQSALKEAAAAVRKSNPSEGVAREKEILFRLISGMHTAITTSIVSNFYHEETGELACTSPQ